MWQKLAEQAQQIGFEIVWQRTELAAQQAVFQQAAGILHGLGQLLGVAQLLQLGQACE